MRWPSLLGLLALVSCLPPAELPAPAVAIEPETPAEGDDLVLVVDDLGDNPAGLAWSIEWRRNGERQDDLADEVEVGSDLTTTGDEWSVRVSLDLGGRVGPAGLASVTIGGGDDDDTVDDDDISPDDDDLPEESRGGHLCAAAGVSSNGTHTTRSCTGPVEVAPGVTSNGTYTIRIGRLAAE